ncbi:hypothetical protein ACQ4LE_000837 [Meloidogyne hapla]
MKIFAFLPSLIIIVDFIPVAISSPASNKLSPRIDARIHLKKICRIEKDDESDTQHKVDYCDDAVFVAAGAAETSCKRSVSRAAGKVNCDALIFTVPSVQKSCSNALQFNIVSAQTTLCKLSNIDRECCEDIITDVVKTVEPFCLDFANASVNFALSLCKLTKSFAVNAANEGCSLSVTEAASFTQKQCYKSMGVPFSEGGVHKHF